MSEAKAAVLFNVWPGDNGWHPNQDRLVGMAHIVDDLAKRGVSVDVLYGEQEPQPGNVQPQVGVSHTFEYNADDTFNHATARWENHPGDLSNYHVIIDQSYRWIHRTPDLSRSDYYVSPGIGVPASHVINSWLAHKRGNDKTLAHNELLVPNNAGLDTYTINDLKELEDTWQDIPMFAKPVSGSCGRDIESPNSLRELEELIAAGRVTSDYQIQPRIDTTLPIRGLVAHYSSQQFELDKYNNSREYVKERRHHVFATEIDGVVDIKLSSTLRVGQQGAQQMGRANSKWIALSQESLPESDKWHVTLTNVAKSLHEGMSAEAEGSPVHFMIAIDDTDAEFPNGEQRPVVMEVNTRFAGLPKEAVAAQENFRNFVAAIALANARA